MCFSTLGILFLGNHGNIIGKYHVFVPSVSSANTSENLGSKTLKMKKRFSLYWTTAKDAKSDNIVACCWGFVANNVVSICICLKV